MAKSTDHDKTPRPDDPDATPDIEKTMRPPDASDADLDEDAYAALIAGSEEPTEPQPEPAEAGSAVNLGRPGEPPIAPATPASEDSFEWANLVGEQPPSSHSPAAVRVDAPSDVDILARASAEAAAAEAGSAVFSGQQESVIPASAAVGHPEGSNVNFGDAPPAYDPLDSTSHPRPGETHQPRPAPEPIFASPGETHEPGRAPELVAPPGGADTMEVEEAILLPDSSVSLGEGGVTEVPESKEPIEAGSGSEVLIVDESPSAVDLGSQPLIAELASDVALGGTGAEPVVFDSSVRLGEATPTQHVIGWEQDKMRATDPMMPPLTPPPARPPETIEVSAAEVLRQSALDPGPGSAIDLGGPAPGEKKGEDSSSVDLGGVVEVAEVSNSSSIVDLEGAVLIEEDASYSGDVLAAPSNAFEVLPEQNVASDVVVGADVASEATGSSINLADAVAEEALLAESPSGPKLGDSGVASMEDQLGTDYMRAGESGVNLGAGPDLIAEAVESGIGLGATAASPIGPTSSKPSEVVLDHPAMPEETPSHSDINLEQFARPPADPAALALPGAKTGSDSSVDLGSPVVEEAGPDLVPVHEHAVEDSAIDEVAETHTWSGEGPPDAESDEAAAAALLEAAEDVDLGGPRVPTGDSGEGTLEDKTSGAAVEEGAPLDQDLDDLFADAKKEGEEEAKKEAEDEKDEETTPRPQRTGPAWLGGALVGVGGSIAACAVLWFAGVLSFGRTEEKLPDGPAPRKIDAKVVDIRNLNRQGDFRNDPPQIDETKAEDLIDRGEYRWIRYLQAVDPKTRKFEDPQVKEALADLEKAQTLQMQLEDKARAMLWQGHIHETFGRVADAAKIYDEGAKAFGADINRKLRFDAAKDRLQLSRPAAPPVGGGVGLHRPSREQLDALVTLLVLVQQPGENPDDTPEAGFLFWSAVSQATKQVYQTPDKKGAIDLIKKAAANHDARRRLLIRRAQNPSSDPEEKIFLEVCRELEKYWTIQEQLKNGKYLDADKRTDPVQGVADALAAVVKAQNDNKVLQEKLTTEEGLNKTAKTTITELEAKLKTEETAKKALQTQVDNVNRVLKEKDTELLAQKKTLEAQVAKTNLLEKDKKDLFGAFSQVSMKVKLPGFDPARGLKPLLDRIDDVVAVANTTDPTGALMKSREELAKLKGTLEQRWTPEAMLSYWSTILADRDQKRLTEPAVKDVARVRGEADAKADLLAEAMAIEGLAFRNNGNYDKARETLTKALGMGTPDVGAWRPVAKQALAELTDPEVYYLRRARALREDRRHDDALAVLTEGLKVFPANANDLYALRALVRLDDLLDKGKGKLLAGAPGIEDAEADANKAAGTPAGLYALGRIHEEMSRRPEALKAFEEAAALAKEETPEHAVYAVAQARVILQPLEGKKAETRQDAEPEVRRAMDLAEKVLRRKDVDSMPLVKAEALAIQQRWTEALEAEAAGLRPQLSRESADSLATLLANHPIRRVQEPRRVGDPLQADRSFAAGLAHYFDRNYAAAEREFEKAISYFFRDARFHYFLGLARLQQGKRGAQEHFMDAAKLERQEAPARETVDASLERVQGRLRDMINDARDRAR